MEKALKVNWGIFAMIGFLASCLILPSCQKEEPKDDQVYVYFIRVKNTGLPVVRIETPEKRAVTSKTVWMDQNIRNLKM